jgi:hypothetical protein
MGPQHPAPELPWRIGAPVRPFANRGLWLLAIVGSILALAGLAAVERATWPLLGSVPLVGIAAMLIHALVHRPIGFTFDRDTIVMRRLTGGDRFDPALLDSIELLPEPRAARLILRFADGARLVLRPDEIDLSIEEVEVVLRRLLTPLAALSPWPRDPAPYLLSTAFGPGSRRPFSAYLEGPSTVAVESVDDICGWLRGCEYVLDEELFDRVDVWQHPKSFEGARRGDCEDHALWAWRKLVDLKLEAELVVGTWEGEPHAWVTFVQDRRVFLLETTTKKGSMIHPADEVRESYRPRYGVNRHLVTHRYRRAGSQVSDSGR